MADEFCLKMPDFHVTFRDILHAVDLQHWRNGFTYFPSEGRRAEDFFALKNPTASAAFEPANLGTKDQHATSRPPKPLKLGLKHTAFSNVNMPRAVMIEQISYNNGEVQRSFTIRILDIEFLHFCR